MYGKYFASTFTGSMVGAGINVFAVWGYIIANCKNGSVELNPKLLSMILGCHEDDVNSALRFLESPDAASRSKEKDGRRILKTGPYFYDVPNHASYRRILNDDERREYFRDKKREERQKKKVLTVGHIGQSKTVKDMSTVSTQAEAEADTKAEEKKKSCPSDVFLTAWNSLPERFSKIRNMSESRKLKFRARMHNSFWSENWLQAIAKIPESAFLGGVNDRGWVIDADFFLKPDSLEKIIEGKYESKQPVSTQIRARV